MLRCMVPWATSPFIRFLSQDRSLDLLPSAQDQNSFWLQSHRLQTSPIPKVDRVATGTHKHAESHSTTDANGRTQYTVVKHTTVNMQHHIVSQIQMAGHNTMLWNIQQWKRCKLMRARWIASTTWEGVSRLESGTERAPPRPKTNQKTMTAVTRWPFAHRG